MSIYEKRKYITLEELIEELQKANAKSKAKRIISIGTLSGCNASYIFRFEDDSTVTVSVYSDSAK